MKLSLEISLYPLQDNYIPIIDDFLADINAQALDVEIRTSNMSTRIFGNYQDVMDCLTIAMKRSMQRYGKVVFVCKFLEGDARNMQNYD